jgi:hypothetical protein
MKCFATRVGMCLLLLAVSGVALGQKPDSKADSVTGKWECVAHGSVQGDVPFTLTLQQKGETVTGTIATADGELEITSGSYKNNALEIHCETDDAKYLVAGELKGDQLKGHWSKTGGGDDQGGGWEGKRSTSAEPPAK